MGWVVVWVDWLCVWKGEGGDVWGGLRWFEKFGFFGRMGVGGWFRCVGKGALGPGVG